MHAAHIVMASAQRAVAAHSHAYESKQSSSTTSYPVREQSSMASRKCRPGLGHPVREYVEIGHDPQRAHPAQQGTRPPQGERNSENIAFNCALSAIRAGHHALRSTSGRMRRRSGATSVSDRVPGAEGRDPPSSEPHLRKMLGDGRPDVPHRGYRTFIPRVALHRHIVGPIVRWAMSGPPPTGGPLDNRAPTRRSGAGHASPAWSSCRD